MVRRAWRLRLRGAPSLVSTLRTCAVLDLCMNLDNLDSSRAAGQP